MVDPARLAEDAPDLAELGWDPLEDPLPWVDFARLVLGRRQQLKALLTDQKVIAGLGNIYSDEVLHAAGLRYDRLSNTLTVQEVRRLFRAIIEIVHEAVGGPGEQPGRRAVRRPLRQAGQLPGPAPGLRPRGARRACGAGPRIERTKWGGRSTFYCPACQV